MAGFVRVNVMGLKELADALKALPEEVSGRSGGPLRAGLHKAAKVFQEKAKQNADTLPVSNVDDIDDYIRTGNLGKSIKIKRDPNPPSGVTEATYVKPRARYWVPVEFGSEKMPARPFMRPAFESEKMRALDVFKVELRKAIDRAAKKAAKLGLIRGR